MISAANSLATYYIEKLLRRSRVCAVGRAPVGVVVTEHGRAPDAPAREQRATDGNIQLERLGPRQVSTILW
jgi:hypothetical protein